MPFDGTSFVTQLETLPTFKPRKRSFRLDYRPVAWSLLNRPADWEWQTPDITIKHRPSGHVFWVAIGGIYLFDADCTCKVVDHPKPTFWDQRRLKHAFREWKRRPIDPKINAQFASHFLTPEYLA